MKLFDRKRNVSFSGTVLSARSLNFIGSFSRSPNNLYTIAWEQSGVYLLCKEESVLLSGRVGNPFQGIVSNCGAFALVSPGQGSARSATLRVFDQGGNVLLTKRFSFNIGALGLSSSGSHVACQLMDGDVVLIELAKGTVVWKVAANPTGNLRLDAESLGIDVRNGWVNLNLAIGGKPRISFAGEHLDVDVIRASRLRSAQDSPNGLALFYLVREGIDESEGAFPPERAEDLLKLLEEAHQHGFKDYPDCEAKAHRAAGEIFEAINQPSEALRQYAIAVQVDPKVGVKRRVDALEKKLSQAEPTQTGPR